MACDPLSALVPDHEPEPEQLVAFLVDQVSVEPAPESTVLGLALKVITGAKAETVTVTDCLAEPPGPVQDSSYSVVLERGPVDQVPLGATAPCQPPEAIHAVALTACHLKVDVPPSATVDGAALNVAIGEEEITMTLVDPDPDRPEPVQVSV